MGGQEGGVMGGGREGSVDSSFGNLGSERRPHCRQPEEAIPGRVETLECVWTPVQPGKEGWRSWGCASHHGTDTKVGPWGGAGMRWQQGHR